MHKVDPRLLHQFYLVPVVAFHKVTKHWAFANGIKVFTWQQTMEAMASYFDYASRNN